MINLYQIRIKLLILTKFMKIMRINKIYKNKLLLNNKTKVTVNNHKNKNSIKN